MADEIAQVNGHERTWPEGLRSADKGEVLGRGPRCWVRDPVWVDSVAPCRSLLALLLARMSVLAWTVVDTSGLLNLLSSEFLLAPVRLTRERSQV
ncbi:MAG: hypothetical protein OEV40_31870, partial [Acidimicrobiia bacterium]|nr:hypothetical protein [Acidimicrobiia bacterium]